MESEIEKLRKENKSLKRSLAIASIYIVLSLFIMLYNIFA
jgi:hypothetical protein